MLDQNTDRMWYVIGAVIVGAAIIFLVNKSFPQMFVNIGDTFGTSVNAWSSIGVHTPEAEKVYEDWADKYLTETGGKMFVNGSDDAGKMIATSEGQGYGMLMVATQPANKTNKERYEKMYAYYMANRGHGTALMGWQQIYTGSGSLSSSDANNATDGDIFIAESLIQAAKTYPKDKEAYLTQANVILADMLTYNYNESAQILTVSNWSTDNTKEWTVFRSSDVVPSFFSDFEGVSKDERWGEISDSMMSYMLDVSENVDSGLVPDFIDVKSGKGQPVAYEVMWDPESSYYGWSAIRVPMMAGMVSVTGQNRKLLDNMTNFLNDEDPLYAIYHLDGTTAAGYSSVVTAEALNYANLKLGKGKPLDYKLPNGGYYTDIMYALSRVIK